MKILVSDKLGDKGLEVLKNEPEITYDVKTGLSPEELKDIIGEYDAIIIRSGTRLTAGILEKADKLKAIGRAGVGLDNVDIEAASRKGIIVMNTPGGNTISTCEHSIAMLLALTRNIPQANESLKRREWNRSKFMGAEVFGKTLGIVGFGRIGREVAKRMLAFGMKVIVYDPFVTKDSFPNLEFENVSIDVLCKRADYITIHTPKTPETKYMFNKEKFAIMKDGVMIINCARGGIIHEGDLYEALKSGKVKGAALDVFESEPSVDSPLIDLPNVVAVPHLGASTKEAQENVAVAVAHQVIDALLGRGVRNAVNFPSFDPEVMDKIRPWATLAEKLGTFLVGINKNMAISKISVKYSGDVAKYQLKPLTLSLLKGLLSPILEDGEVNYVNAPIIAKKRGMEVVESSTSMLGDFSNAILVEAETGDKVFSVMGTLFGNNAPRVVKVNEYYVDADLEGVMLVIRNEDKPGFIGEVGTILGKNNVNIAEMTLGRTKEGDSALTIINTDQKVESSLLEEIKKIDKVIDANVVVF